MDHTLFTYRNLEELRKIQEERELFTFMFVETKEMFYEDTGWTEYKMYELNL